MNLTSLKIVSGCAFLTLICSFMLSVDSVEAQGPQTDLFDEHLSSMQTGMTVLGGWALSNIVVGGVARRYVSGPQRYFHEMNAGWNAINLGIAALGYLTLPEVAPDSGLEALKDLNRTDHVLIFNAGLDLAYMALGYGLMERGRRLDSPRYIGYGQSLLLQGAFLFAFDAALAYMHSDLTGRLRVYLIPPGLGASGP